MKKFLVALFLLGTSLFSTAEIVTVPIPGAPGLSVTVGTGANALPLQDIRTNPAAVNITQGDDSWTEVPLGFNFPFFGRTFTNSWAMTNGMVTFQDPVQSGLFGACCSGVDLRTTTNPTYNYSIYAVHTDLYSSGTNNQYYLRENNAMTYGWYNVSQCCSNAGGNNFEIKINSNGGVDTRIAGALVQWNAVTSGMAGDLSKGEYYQFYHGQGWNINTTTGGVSWNTIGGFSGTDICTTNPLSSPSCPNYFTAQCTVSALYNSACPGYQQAYFTQQCSINPLYDVQCAGYAQAYLDYQCSRDPLYSTTCQGYETAYFNQQCSINPLYNSRCTGYDDAYFAQQCSLNGLYSRSCPNYSTAYATKMLLEQQGTATIVATAGTVAAMAPQPTTTTTTDSSGEVKVAVVADQNVNTVITNTATSASPAQAATATVPLAPPPPPPADLKAAPPADKPAGGPPPPQGQQPQGGEKPQPSARQEIQAKRMEAAKKEAVEKGKNLAGAMGKVADMEAQKQVQNVVIQAMGFTPGFDAYGKVMVPDALGYKPFTVYNGQVNVDNRRLGWGLYGPSDKLHNDLVGSQYKD